MAKYKNQHTVTKAYLRGFTAEETPNTLWRYDKSNGTYEQSRIDKATVKFYAYSFRQSDGQWNHEAERILGEVESTALPLLSKLESGESLSDAEKDELALFIAAMFRRPAPLLAHFQQLFMQYANDPARKRRFLEDLMPELRKQFSEEEIETARNAVDKGDLDVLEDTAKAMQMAEWFRMMPRHSQMIANMHWQVWRADSGCYFITSDAPAFVRREGHYEDKTFVAIGQADLNAELIFPISKRALLIAKHRPCKEVQKATKTRVKELNSLTVRMAHRYVFACENTEPMRSLVERNRGFSPPMPDLSNLGRKRA